MPETSLEAAHGWSAQRVATAAGELTHIAAVDIFRTHGNRELVALDRRGICWMLLDDGGEWLVREAVHDGRPLAALGHGKVDPRVAGPGTFVGGESGTLYRIGVHPHGALDLQVVAHFPGEKIRFVLAGDLDLFQSGDELVVFTDPGGAFTVHPEGEHGAWTSAAVNGLPRGVRDAVLLPFEVGQLPVFATASSRGETHLASLTPDGPEVASLFAASVGATSVTVGTASHGEGPIVYTALDDGRVLRHRRDPRAGWLTEPIYSGPKGPRALAAGRFDSDPSVEALAVCQADGSIVLLTRTGDRFATSTLLEPSGYGTALVACEIDGRNMTDELVACRANGEIVILARSEDRAEEDLP